MSLTSASIFSDPNEVLQAILHGNISKGFPDPPPRVIKIFLSSTKADFDCERRHIHDTVIPELQRYCNTLAVDLLVIDSQWKNDSMRSHSITFLETGGSTSSQHKQSMPSYLLNQTDIDTINPHEFALQQREIDDCHRQSLATFFVCLIGHKYKPVALPLSIDSSDFEQILLVANEAGLGDASLLNHCYRENKNLQPSAQYVLVNPRRASREHEEEIEHITKIVEYGAKVASREGILSDNFPPLLSAIHQQIHYALKLTKSKSDSDRLLCFIRQFEGVNFNNPSVSSYFDVTPTATTPSPITELPLTTTMHSTKGVVEYSPSAIHGVRQLIEDVICGFNRGNVHYFNISWDIESNQQRDCDDQLSTKTSSVVTLPGDYLDKFGDTFLRCIKTSIENSINRNPFEYPAEVIRESHSHLCNCRRNQSSIGVSQSLDSDCAPLLQIHKLIINESSSQRHAPIIVVGPDGVGKSTLLSQVFSHCTEWLVGSDEVIRIVRHIGQSPCSSYTSELLRNLCLHISLVYGFEAQQTISYELSALSIWFQDLLKMIETTAQNSDLVIVLDDLHLFRSSQTSAIHGWLPWNLPPNVHLICSVSECAESVLSHLRSRISSDNFVRLGSITSLNAFNSMISCKLRDEKRTLTPQQWSSLRETFSKTDISIAHLSPLYANLLSSAILCQWESFYDPKPDTIPCDINSIVIYVLKNLEDTYGVNIIRKICTFLACTRYGLREAEIFELFLNDDATEGNTNVWLAIKERLSPFWREYYVSGRSYLQWKNMCICDSIRNRYITNGHQLRSIHQELATAFHLGFNEVLHEGNNLRKDSDLVREADELWYHLLMSGDRMKLKQNAILNIDFLMTVVKGVSISYLRSVLNLVRLQILDWEIELLYNMTKQSVHVVTQDPNQLAAEILVWLKPFSISNLSNDNTVIENVTVDSCLNAFIDETNNWCNNLNIPILIPSNSWLNLPMPPQVAMITAPWNSITRAVSTPDSQNLIACDGKILHFYNLPSKTLLKSIEGHRETITCLHLSDSGLWLATGSEDTSVNLWEITFNGDVTCKLKHRLNHHIAGVLCLTITHSEDIILSGSEIGAVCAVKLKSGSIIARLEHHRGMITCLDVNSGDDVFVTGSTDCTVAVWSLESYCILNEITLHKPIMHMDISLDSTFLLLACEDNTIHVRALTTGTDVHCLKAHSSGAVISYLKFAQDNCRCILGCGDGKLHVYDIHSARLIQTLSAHNEMITSILPQLNDRFLFTTGGNKIVIWNFYLRKHDKEPVSSTITVTDAKENQQPRSRTSSRKKKKFDNHREPITCVAVSRDACFAVTGSRDYFVKIWHLSTGETHTTLEGHTGPVTCVDFAPNGLFAVSGSEDTTLRVWGLTLGLIVFTFKEHQNPIVTAKVTADSRRILSVDCMGVHRLWMADNGNQLIVTTKPINNVTMHANMVFAVAGKNDNCVRFWSAYDVETERSVTHSESITCYTCTYDCQTIITGSLDMSLKVWEVTTGKLTQVLVGHEGGVTCVATAPLNSTMVISGSQDCNLIVWDMTTGSEQFTLSGHNASITHAKLTLDGSTAVSASEDNTLQLWDTKSMGHRLAILDMHHTFTILAASLNLNQIVVQLANNQLLPIIRFHNNPAKDLILELPPGTPIGGDESKMPPAWRGIVPRDGPPKRALLRGNLKREQSFDSFWDHYLHRGASIDDFRKISSLAQVQSPMGSREHLFGNIWDGSVGSGAPTMADRLPQSRPVRLIASKLIGPKQKMLKKQQSMFACFPEFTSGGNLRPQSPLISPQVVKDVVNDGSAAKSTSPKFPVSVRPFLGQLESRSRSLEDTEVTTGNDANTSSKKYDVNESGVCVVS